jgi:hypothetical protein
MMKLSKKLLSVILCLIMVFGSVVAGGNGFADWLNAISIKASAEDYSVGDTIYYGSYPQNKVSDSELIAELNKQNGQWISYNYYSGTGSRDDGNMAPSNFMRYKDIYYNGKKYRAVTFDSYRPSATGEKLSVSSTSIQNNNGYAFQLIHWFEFNPLKWRILDPSTGFIMCDSVIDCQAFSNYVYHHFNSSNKNASDWETSSLREWLNNDFSDTAFSEAQQSNIKVSNNSNKCRATINGTVGYEDYDSNDTQDKIFLLSYDEITNNNYGFDPTPNNTDTRILFSSDYAKCQGLMVSDNSFNPYSGLACCWWLRTASDAPSYVCNVGYEGKADGGLTVYSTYHGGVCPAMRLSSLTETASIKKNDSITLEGTITTVENQITAWNTITCYVLILDYPIQFKIDDGAWIYDSNKYLCESVQVDSNAEPYVGKRVSVTGIISFAQLKVDVEDIVLQNCTYELLSGYGASKFFSEPKYIADIWLNQNGKSDTPESRFLDMLLGFDSVSGTMYYELLNDPGFQAGLAGWDGFKAVFDSVEYADQVMSETEVYTTLIFDLLRAVAEENNEEINNVVLDAMDTTGTAGKTVTKHKGYIDNFVSIVDSPAEGLLEVLKEWKFKGSDCQSFQNFYSNLNNINDDYSIWNNNKFIKGIGEIAEIAEDVSDFYAKFTGYLYAVDMAEEMQTLLREMRKYASGNMYTALGDVLNAVGNADYIAAVMTMDLGKDIIVDVADEVFKEVAKCFPEYYALQKAYQAAVAFDNLVFNTSEIRDNYYLIKASTEFIESNKKAVLSLAAKYRQSGSEADAGAYVYATRAYHHAYIIDTDSAASFIKAADDEGAVNQVRKTFMYAENLITGSNNKTNYQQFMESKESTERILKSQFRWLDNSWKFNETYLKTDYPEIFPIYLSEELSSEDYATYVDAYIATSGNTELNWEIPWGFRDEEDNIQILYASTLINGITATETINGVSDVKDYNPEYFSDIPNPIVFSNQSKFSTFPKKYSVVSYSTSTGEKVYTTPVDETLENPIKKVTIEIPMNQLSGSVWQNNGITFWIIDRSNSRYQNIVYDVYRSTDGSSWQKIGSSSRQSDSAWFFAGKTSTGFCDESAAEGHTYSYKVISSFNFGNGKTLRSPESQVFAVTKSAGTALAPASVRLTTGGTG